MNPPKRQIVLFGVMVAMLAIVVVWCAMNMLGQKGKAQREANSLAQAKQIAERVEVLRQHQAVASPGGDWQQQEQELAQRISDAAAKARINIDWQKRIEYKRARRVADTPYMRKPVVVYTEGLTMDQLVALLHHLTYDSPLIVSELDLKTPRGGNPGNRWDANITLSYLIYEPATNRPGS